VSGEGDRLEGLERQMTAMLDRLEALERETAEPEPAGMAGDQGPEDAVEGTLAFTGSIRLGQRRFRVQQRVDLLDALEADPALVARMFAALGSPFRVRLLRLLLDGPRTSQELQTELEVGAVGQLYHHLKELLAAGLITQRRRSVYAIREEIVMPLCLAFVVAPRLAYGQAREEATET
jgi:DNA-binding transcriptional ArsR family regulator